MSKKTSNYPKTRKISNQELYAAFGECSVACENDEIGFMVRDDLTMDKLQAHLERMRKEGFTVTEMTI